MQTQIIETVPTRENWQQFCEEADLAKEEWATWYELAAVARENDELADFIEDEAAKEITEYFYQSGGYTKDWSDVVTSADKFRRMRRAQIAAWQKWADRTSRAGA